MSRLSEAIDREIEAAENLTRACARHGALADATANDNDLRLSALRKSYRVSSVTPNDMLQMLGKLR